jgi:hypothetical protein
MEQIEQTKEDKLDEIKSCISQKDSLYYIHMNDSEAFGKSSEAEGKSVIPIMTYGDYIVYLKADCSNIPNIPLSKFNYTSGTFEKKWGPNHKTIVLTPTHSSIRKVEIEIQGMNIQNMRLLPDKNGDVIEDVAKIKITRHYRFAEGTSENKKDTRSASPGETDAR